MPPSRDRVPYSGTGNDKNRTQAMTLCKCLSYLSVLSSTNGASHSKPRPVPHCSACHLAMILETLLIHFFWQFNDNCNRSPVMLPRKSYKTVARRLSLAQRKLYIYYIIELTLKLHCIHVSLSLRFVKRSNKKLWITMEYGHIKTAE